MKNQQNISEMDQMAIAAILSTQLLQQMFITNPVATNVEELANLKVVIEN